jgi:hypothetical protein
VICSVNRVVPRIHGFVTDILKWVHLDQWLTRMRRLGYAHRTVVLNSA